MVSPSLYILNQDPWKYPLVLGLVAISAYSVAGTQDALKRNLPKEDEERSNLTWLLGLILSFIHYNGVVIVSAIVGGAFTLTFGLSAGLLFTIFYVFWDIETRAYAIPLSVGGILVFGLAIFLLLQMGGRAAYRKLREDGIGSIAKSIFNSAPNALKIMDRPERKPFKFAARKIKR